MFDKILFCLMATALLLSVLIFPPTASGQYTFGDWASDNDYSPGAVMPITVSAKSSSIDSLSSIGDYDWTTTPTMVLALSGNQLSSLESGAFSGLTNLTYLHLNYSSISSIKSAAFSGLSNLEFLYLNNNPTLKELNLAKADFSSLTRFNVNSERQCEYHQCLAGKRRGEPDISCRAAGRWDRI